MSKPKIGQRFRSEENKVLLTLVEWEEEKNLAGFRVGASPYVLEGPTSNIPEFFEACGIKEISEESFQEYLKTYEKDIEEHNKTKVKG